MVRCNRSYQSHSLLIWIIDKCMFNMFCRFLDKILLFFLYFIISFNIYQSIIQKKNNIHIQRRKKNNNKQKREKKRSKFNRCVQINFFFDTLKMVYNNIKSHKIRLLFRVPYLNGQMNLWVWSLIELILNHMLLYTIHSNVPLNQHDLNVLLSIFHIL
jgi:hypothetical protein